MVEQGGGGGAMSFLKRFPPPADGVRHQQPDTEALLAGRSLGSGTLYIAESRLSWLENSGVGFSLDYPTISLHAVSRDLSAYPREHLYVMVNAKFEEETKEAPMTEGEEDDSDDDVEPIAEFRFVPSDKSALEAMFSAMCECQALHPDPDDEDSDNDYEGDEYDVEARELEQGDIPSFYTYEEGLSHLTAEGQATLERLEGMLAQSVSTQYNMAGVRTEDSIREFEGKACFCFTEEYVFISDTASEIECTLNKFANTKLRGAVDTPEGWDAIQRVLNETEEWIHGNLMRFNKAKCKVLHLGWSNSQYQHRLGEEGIKSSPAKKDVGVLVDEKLDITWQWSLSPEHQLCPGLYSKQRGQQGKGGESAPLLHSGETPPAVLHPAA